MMEKPRAEMEMQDVLQDQQDERAHGGGGGLYDNQQSESERQDQKQVNVASGNYLVEGELHMKRRCQGKRLQENRKD